MLLVPSGWKVLADFQLVVVASVVVDVVVVVVKTVEAEPVEAHVVPVVLACRFHQTRHP